MFIWNSLYTELCNVLLKKTDCIYIEKTTFITVAEFFDHVIYIYLASAHFD